MEAASSVQQKDKMADGTPRGLCVTHFSSMRPISAERGRVISGHLTNRFRSRFGTNILFVYRPVKEKHILVDNFWNFRLDQISQASTITCYIIGDRGMGEGVACVLAPSPSPQEK